MPERRHAKTRAVHEGYVYEPPTDRPRCGDCNRELFACATDPCIDRVQRIKTFRDLSTVPPLVHEGGSS